MIQNPLKILHTGDIQIEVRNHQQRYDEYNFILHKIEKQIELHKPDIYVLAGDIFEYCKPNDMERLLFISHLKMVVQYPFIKEIIITYGNHDVDQRKSSNFFKVRGSDVPAENSLDSIVEAVDNEKIQLFKQSTIYQSRIKGLQYLNWSQKTKHSEIVDELYNPCDNLERIPDTDTLVTIFHDPIRGCKQWDGTELKGAQKSYGLEAFVTLTILAGDIHKPQCIRSGNQQLIYCGSPVARNFGEGDYYKDGRLVQSNAYQHTINVGTLQPTGMFTNQEFIRIQQYRTFSTFEISTKKTIDRWDLLNWKVESPGIFETSIKVKLPSATETYLKAEPEIIDAIAAQNPNLLPSIQFFYGKAIDAEEPELLQSSDLEKLLTEEKITQVASDYIQQQVQKSASILPEDKEQVIKLITDLFVTEMKNFSADIVSNRIQMEQITIDNFMSFGSGLKVDMKSLYGLVKLTGGNGVGKTTFYNAIKWVLTGFISREQNRVKKNENNLLIMNDYRWNVDETSVQLQLRINGNVAIVKRTTTREWKKNVTDADKQLDTWKSLVTSTTQTISVTIDDKVLQGQVAEDWLHQIFGGLENLERIVFPNQYTLESLVCSDAGRLCEEVLNHIGMNFFDRMAARYDALRKDTLSGLAKPAQTIDALKQQHADNELLKQDLYTELDNIGSDIGAVDMNLYSCEETIKSLQTKLHPGINKESIQQEQQAIKEEQQSLAEREQKAKQAHELIQEKLSQTTLQTLEQDVKTSQQGVSAAEQQVSQSKLESEQLQSTIALIKADIKNRTLEIDADFAEQLQQETTKQSSVEKTILECKHQFTQCNERMDKILQAYIQSIHERQTTKQNELNLVTASIVTSTEKQEQIKQQIKQLESATVCPTCNRPLEAEHVEHIQQQLQSLHKQLNQETKTLTEKQQQLHVLESKIDTLQQELQLAPEYIVDDMFYMREQQERDSIVERRHAAEQELVTIQQSVESITAKRKTAVHEDETILQLLEKHKTAQYQVTELATTIEIHETRVKQATDTLKEANESLASYNQWLQKLEQIQTLQQTIKSEQQLLQIRVTRVMEQLQQLEDNINIQHQIDTEVAQQQELKDHLAELQTKEKQVSIQLETCKQRQQQIEQSIKESIQYRITEQSLKQYKTLLGKQGLPQHIFSMIRGLLNHRLNDLLEYLSFRLHFNTDNELRMIDLSKPGNPVRIPMQMSGMQTVFTGLSLIYVNRLCNNTFIMDHLFIDEVSGQLNTGEELTYEFHNYQEQLKKLLKQFTGLKVWIVDHVIEDMEEDCRLEVSPSNHGASIKVI